MKAIILAGGFGTRLKEITGEDIPKPMVLMAGKPFLEHLINFLKENGITEIILAVHHMADKIKSYFGTGSRWGINLTYSEENIPLGTAGAIKNAEKYINDTFLVLNGDSYPQINIKEFLEFHRTKKSRFTIALIESKNHQHFGSVILKEGKINEFLEKEQVLEDTNHLVNTGIYLFEPIIFDYIQTNKSISLEKEIFPKLAKQGFLWGYEYKGYFMDIGRPETYYQFKQDILKSLFIKPEEKIRKAMQKIMKNEIDLVLVIDSEEKLLGVLNDKIIKRFLLAGGDIEALVLEAMEKEPSTIGKVTDDKQKIYNLLLDTRHLPILDENRKVIDVEFRIEKIKTETFPVIKGRAPLRISFAGGGTDLPDFFEKYGGIVINSTIDKYCYATLVKRADSKVIINSDLYPGEFIFDLNEIKYDGNFNLIKAIIKIMKPEFGFDFYLYNDAPPGRGLGSSASLAVLIVKLISTLQNLDYDDYKIAEIAHQAETEELKIKGGWQDQYATVTGGFSFIEFNSKKTIIYPLRLKEEVINELNSRLLLCYVGKAHFSGELQENLASSIEKKEDVVTCLKELKDIAVEIKDCLLTNNLEKIGELLHKSWENKKRCSDKISNPNIDALYEIGRKNGAQGGKLLGAGGGGYILFFASPEKRNVLKNTLEKVGGEILNFNFEFHGTKIWFPKKS